MATSTNTGKTGSGSASLGGTFVVDALAIHVTAITSAQVRQGLTVNGSKKLQWAGSFGTQNANGGITYVSIWEQITFDNISKPGRAGDIATHVFWALRPGVTATITLVYH